MDVSDIESAERTFSRKFQISEKQRLVENISREGRIGRGRGSSYLYGLCLWQQEQSIFSCSGCNNCNGRAACIFYYYKMSFKQFGGITGDLAGYFLQICELVMLTVVAFLGGIC